MQKEHPMRQMRAPRSFGIVVLAAGRSQRMGTPKMLLPWAGTSVLGHIVAQWRSLPVGQLTVVLSAGSRNLARELDRLGFPQGDRIQNSAPDRGMFSSIQCAARWPGWVRALTHWVISLGDQPQLKFSTCRQLLEFADQNPDRVCQPLYRGKWRHPVVLPKALFVQLQSTPVQTLKDFLEGTDRAGLECQDPGLDHDIDTPEDYQTALALARAPAGTKTSPR